MRDPQIPWEDDHDAPRYLYVFKSGEFMKVGIAKDIEKRLEAARLLNPHELICVLRRTVAKSLVRSVEMRMHELLKPWHHDREWFKAPLEEIRKAAALAMRDGEKIARRDYELTSARHWALKHAEWDGTDPEKARKAARRHMLRIHKRRDQRLAAKRTPTPIAAPDGGST